MDAAVTVDSSPVGSVVRPESGVGDGAVLYVHADRYLMPEPDAGLRVATALARETGSVVVCAAWRPRYPAALTDVLAAYGYCQTWGDVAVAGTRIGAGLVAGLMLHLRNLGGTLPRCAVLISGLLDLTLDGSSLHTNHSDPSFDPATLKAGVDRYAVGTSVHDELLSPRRGNLHGLPPTQLLIAGTDPLLDDSLSYATAAARSGVTVELRVRQDAATMRADGVTLAAGFLRGQQADEPVRPG